MMASDKDTQIVMKVPEEIIKAQVQAAVVEALSKSSGAMIAAMVRDALNEADSRSYGRTTKWETMVNDLIREEARAGIKEWVESHRAEIRARVMEAMNKRPKARVTSIADAMINALTQSLHVSVSIKSDD